MSDMKTLNVRDLNRNTASVLDALERGDSFELRRNGRTIGYLTRNPPGPEQKPDWNSHFAWLSQQRERAGGFGEALAEERRRARGLGEKPWKG